MVKTKLEDKCHIPLEKLVEHLYLCLDGLNIMSIKMDKNYIKCLSQKRNEPDEFKECLNNVEKQSQQILTFLNQNSKCHSLHCIEGKSSKFVDISCLLKTNISFLEMDKYLIEIDKFINKLNHLYIVCNQSNDKTCLKRLIKNLSLLNDQILFVCEKIKPRKKIDTQFKMEKKIVSQEMLHQHLVHKIHQLNQVIDKELTQLKNQNKKTKLKKIKKKEQKLMKQENKLKKRNGKKSKSGCKPWQECWIKESGYDPQKDVQNIYYGFYDSCQTALHPLEGCNPKAAVYFAPPPQGF